MIINTLTPVFVVIIGSTLFALQQFQLASGQNEAIYENNVSGLRVPYPSDWSVNEANILPDGTGYVEFLPSNGSSSIRIGNTYEEFLPEGIAKITAQEIAKTFEDFRLIDEGPLSINSRDAYEIYLTYKHPIKGMVTNEYIFIDADDKLFTFSLQDTVTLGEYIRMASAMLDMVYSAEFGGSGLGKLEHTDPNQIKIIFERSPCFGTCPYYSLQIFGNGTVIYNGYKFVNMTGQHYSNIDGMKVRELVNDFSRINFFSLNDSYTDIIETDHPTVITSINISGVYKEVVDNQGAIAPEGLRSLYDKIDKITNSSKWVYPYELPPGKKYYEILLE